MREVTIESIVDFVREADNYDLIAEKIIFRGQPKRGNLVPAIARSNRKVDTTELEKKVLEQLSLMGAALLPNPAPSPLDLLVIAQHWGLKTRLLDWTSNPLAALWFACADREVGDVFVYALEANSVLVQDIYDSDPFDIPQTRVFQPRLNNPRIVAQHGWFTLHRYSQSDHMFVPLERNRGTKRLLTQIRVPNARRIDLLKSLDRHGIGSGTLFPDLGGLCQHLNWKYDLSKSPDNNTLGDEKPAKSDSTDIS
jgi:hypothetical protein